MVSFGIAVLAYLRNGLVDYPSVRVNLENALALTPRGLSLD
jgi:hypothetical protein